VSPPSTPSAPLVLADDDYRFGSGDLTLRVQRIDYADPFHIDGERWYPVRGVQIGWNGNEVGSREVLVRGRRLDRARRPAATGPGLDELDERDEL
jgi:hypothetical protein